MTEKVCTACGMALPLSRYAPSKQGRHGVKSECRECTKRRDAAYRAANRERLRQYKQQWRETSPKAENERRCTSQQPERVRKRASDWQKANPGKAGARNARRRAAKHSSIPAWADQKAIESIYSDAKKLTKQTGIQWHVDHIVPLQSPIVCGLHCESNLHILPGLENCSKSNRYWPDMP